MRRAADTPCDDPAMTVWLDAVKRGLDVEYLPLYLIAYRTLAEMETAPVMFATTALRYEHRRVIHTIDETLASLEASARSPIRHPGSWISAADRP